MRYARSQSKATRRIGNATGHSATGREAIAMAPPAYGIDFVDRDAGAVAHKDADVAGGPASHRSRCGCPSCGGIQMKQSECVTQLALKDNKEVAKDNDNTIAAGLTAIDTYAGKNTLNFKTDIWVTNMGTQDDMIKEATGAMSVAADGGTRYVEGSRKFAEAAGYEKNPVVDWLGNRRAGVHSEQHFENKKKKPSAVWCSWDNCIFCNGFLESKNIKHQAMKSSNKMPEMWEHPTLGWKVVKEMTNKHTAKPNTLKWQLTGHGGTAPWYFNEKHEK